MRPRILLLGVGLALWLGSLAASAAVFERYARTPGSAGEARPVADAEAGAKRESGDAWRVTMYAHPRCPCTRASLTELARVAEAVGDGARVEYEVVMYRPQGAGDDWVRGRSWDLAHEIQSVRVAIDPGGRMSAREGAFTSGHVVVRDGAGAVVYAGGVTNGRGETGASAAGEAIIAALRGEEVALRVGPVFGCEITERDARRFGGEQGVDGDVP